MVQLPKISLPASFIQPTKFSRVRPLSGSIRVPLLPFSPFFAVPAVITVAWLFNPVFSSEIKSEMVVRTKNYFFGK